MPLHPVALELLTITGPLAATGANYAAMAVPLTQTMRSPNSARRWRSTSTPELLIRRGPPPSSTSPKNLPGWPEPGSVDLDRLRLACPDIDTSLE